MQKLLNPLSIKIDLSPSKYQPAKYLPIEYVSDPNNKQTKYYCEFYFQFFYRLVYKLKDKYAFFSEVTKVDLVAFACKLFICSIDFIGVTVFV